VYEVLESDSPVGMVPMIRNILGGFLFSGDDIYKKAAVLSGGERTRLAVARMLLKPANTLLLDEPTNHLDLDSKDVLLDALEDFGGTLIFVSHDLYFVDKLATKIIAVGHGTIEIYPGTYEEYLWSKAQRAAAAAAPVKPGPAKPAPARPTPAIHSAAPQPSSNPPPQPAAAPPPRPVAAPKPDYEDKKRADAEARKRKKHTDARDRRIADLEGRIAEREQAIKSLEAQMATPGFYDSKAEAQQVTTRHQSLMWEVGDLMHQWEMLQTEEPTE
jgi:ATP-binding cassette subfamily F protein 3